MKKLSSPVATIRRLRGLELKTKVSLALLLFSLPFINFFVPDPLKIVFQRAYEIPAKFGEYADVYSLIFLAPIISFFLSIPFYFASDKAYKTWLWWTGICLLVFMIVASSDTKGFFGDELPLYATFLAILYASVSLIGFIIDRIIWYIYKRKQT
jgi:hypothetical protein